MTTYCAWNITLLCRWLIITMSGKQLPSCIKRYELSKNCMLGNNIRDWSAKFANGLNIKKVIVQKVYEWPGWYFAKMMPPLGDHFDKRTTLSVLYFLHYAYFYIWSIRKFCRSVSSLYRRSNSLIYWSTATWQVESCLFFKWISS